MNDILKFAGGFLLGSASGAIIASVILKKKYQAEYDQTVKSFKETYKPREKDIPMENPNDIESVEEDNSVKEELDRLTRKYRTSYNDIPSFKTESSAVRTVIHEEPELPKVIDHPYIINEEDFGEELDYEQICLTYYADGKLADDDDELVENAEIMIGTEWQEKFDKYDEWVVYVRNDERKCEYEISKDNRKYLDVISDKPYLLHNVFDSNTISTILSTEDE